MAKPWIHAKSDVKRWGGKPEDYLRIHQHFDETKGMFPDMRHRALRHHSAYVAPDGPLERLFGVVLTNSAGVEVSVRSIGEHHLLMDFAGCIPTVQDYLMAMAPQLWMAGRQRPPSAAGLPAGKAID